VFRGEESLATSSVAVELGERVIEADPGPSPLLGNCETCHSGIFDLSRMLHYNGDTKTCTACHLPLEFETNNLLPYRIHRIHNLSERYTEDRNKCARWLVCTACHDPWKTHRHYNYSGDLGSCGDFYCHHAVNPVIHDMGQDE
jgi:hypothetical protein